MNKPREYKIWKVLKNTLFILYKYMTSLYLWEQFANNENTASTDLELLVWVKKELLDTFEQWLIENSTLYWIKNGVVVKLDEWATTENVYIKNEEHY